MKVGVHELRQGPAWVSLSQNVLSGADLDGSALPTVTTSNQYDTYLNGTQVMVSTPDGFSKTTNNTYTRFEPLVSRPADAGDRDQCCAAQRSECGSRKPSRSHSGVGPE
jgi:hypothetical protein